jgi:tRNA (guanine-N(7)-)-methyltransferase subunit TRM82
VFHLSGDNNLVHVQDFLLLGNPLDVLPTTASSNNLQSSNQILVSIDTVHEAGSKTVRRQLSDQPGNPFEILELRDDRVVRKEHPGFERFQASQEVEDAKLSNLLYGLEILRKRDGEEKEE